MTVKTLISFALLMFITPLFFTTQSLGGQSAPQKIEIVAKRFDFTPGEVSVKKGVPVTLVLTSKDVDHGVKFRELNVVVNAKKGETKEVTFTPDKVGTFVGQCSVFCGSGHGSMKMTLTVSE